MSDMRQSSVPRVLFSGAPELGETAPQGPSTEIFFDPADLVNSDVPSFAVKVIVAPPAVPSPRRRSLAKPRVRHEDENKVEVKFFSPSDKVWLQDLVSVREIDDDWFEEAEEFVRVGSIDMSKEVRYDDELCAKVLDARSTFFGKHCGWDNPEDPMYYAYQRMKNMTEGIQRPTKSVIASLRLLHTNFDLDVRDMVLKDFDTLLDSAPTILGASKEIKARGKDPKAFFEWAPPIKRVRRPTLKQRWDNIDSSVTAGFESDEALARALAVKSSALDSVVAERGRVAVDGSVSLDHVPLGAYYRAAHAVKEDKIEPRAKLLGEMFTGLGIELERANPEEMMRVAKSIAAMSVESLTTKLLIFADHGRPDISSNDLAISLTLATDNHLLYTKNLFDFQDNPGSRKGYIYRPGNIRAAGKGLDKYRRRERVASLLQDPNYRARIGQPVINAYEQFLVSLSSPRNRK